LLRFESSSKNVGKTDLHLGDVFSNQYLEHAIFESVAVAHQCQNGHAYLLDTSHLHRVMAINDQPRYLFTYGFGVTFEEVYKLYKPKVI
jgi:hypothetical protein